MTLNANCFQIWRVCRFSFKIYFEYIYIYIYIYIYCITFKCKEYLQKVPRAESTKEFRRDFYHQRIKRWTYPVQIRRLFARKRCLCRQQNETIVARYHDVINQCRALILPNSRTSVFFHQQPRYQAVEQYSAHHQLRYPQRIQTITVHLSKYMKLNWICHLN